jgi:Fatty acid hydroxylase superfamily
MSVKNYLFAASQKSFQIYSAAGCALFTAPLIYLAAVLRQWPGLFHSLLFATGWVIWTWTEYLVHRFMMHPKKRSGHNSTSRGHHHHHRQPSKLEIGLIQRIALLAISGLFFYGACRLQNYFTAVTGFAWGGAAFCYIHYLLHHRWTRKFLPNHHRFHIYHHCKHIDCCFGVSVTWWDRLFFTAPPASANVAGAISSFYYHFHRKKDGLEKKEAESAIRIPKFVSRSRA